MTARWSPVPAADAHADVERFSQVEQSLRRDPALGGSTQLVTDFGRHHSADLQRLHEQLDDLVAERDQMSRLLTLAVDISSDLELDAFLRRIVQAAKSMTGARYGAIRVWAEDGSLASFVHAGINEQTIARIGGLPMDKGPLGLLRTARSPCDWPT